MSRKTTPITTSCWLATLTLVASMAAWSCDDGDDGDDGDDNDNAGDANPPPTDAAATEAGGNWPFGADAAVDVSVPVQPDVEIPDIEIPDARPPDAVPPDAAPAVEYPFDTIAPDCMPHPSRPAVLLTFSVAERGCEANLPQDTGFVLIKLFDGGDAGLFPILPGTTFVFEKDSDEMANGTGSLCRHRRDCDHARNGEVTFETFDPGGGATGTWRLNFAGGQSVVGEFDATWCQPDEEPACT